MKTKAPKSKPAAKTPTLALVPAPASPLTELPPTLPKPRKSDIINALVERARIKHQEEQQAVQAQVTACRLEIESYARALLKSDPGKYYTSFEIWSDGVTIKHKLETVSPELRKLLTAYYKARSKSQHFNEVETRKRIVTQMQGGENAGVKALLANPAAVKKLDATLEALAV